MLRRILGLAVMSAGLALASSASASVTYSLGPDGVETNQNAGVTTLVGVNAPMTFSFTLAQALGANLNITIPEAQVLSWSASAANAQTSIDSNDPHEVLHRLHLLTDANGMITLYNIWAGATEEAIPAKVYHAGRKPAQTTVEFLFDTIGGAGTRVTFIEQDEGQIYGIGVCTRGCPTTFTREIDAPPGVPEPAAWALMIAGFGGMGAALRRQSRPRAAA